MKNYIRVVLGSKSIYADICKEQNFIGADYGIHQDLTNELPENWKDFNAKFRDIYLSNFPEKTKIAAGLACGMLWTICKGFNIGDVILSPNGRGSYLVGEVSSDYYYHPGSILPHRRAIKWFDVTIPRAEMSQELRNSTGSAGTTSYVTQYAEEIKILIGNVEHPIITSNDPEIVDTTSFVLEKHLEDFLVQNWNSTELGQKYDIYEEEGEKVGQQFPSDTGPLDILAISKDKKELLVVELKKGWVSDNVVGQIQRYMGYVKEELAEKGQIVKGVIIGLEDDIRIRRALSVTQNIEFYKYVVSFKLVK